MTRDITVPDYRGVFEYIEAPDDLTPANPFQTTVFLAGGITNCPDWQFKAKCEFEASWLLSDNSKGLTLYNPRRPDFDVTDPSASEVQIEWEFRALSRAHLVLFWFTGGESVQPITLYELGRYGHYKKIVVGCDPGYSRRFDVIEQMRHARPLTNVRDSLSDTVQDAVKVLGWSDEQDRR